MSQYYNVLLSNDSTESTRFDANDTSFIPVLENQSEYSVGVHRCKIPLDQDAIRIYEGECFLGFNLDHTNYGSNGSTLTDPENVRMFDLTLAIGGSSARRKYDPVRKAYYASLQSQSKFVSALNACLQLAIRNSYATLAGTVTMINWTSSSQIPETTVGVVAHMYQWYVPEKPLQWTNGDGGAANGVYSLGDFFTFPIGRGALADATSTEVPTYGSRKLLDFEILFGDMVLASGEDIDCLTLHFYVCVLMPTLGGGTDVLKTFCLYKSPFPGLKVSQLAQYFPFGLGFSLSSSLDIRTYDWTTEPIPTGIVIFRPAEADRFRDEFLLSFAEFNKVFIAVTTDKQAASGNETKVTYTLHWNQWSTNTPYWLRGDGAYGESSSNVSSALTAFHTASMLQAMPRFTWDDATQRVSLCVCGKMVGNGVDFYMGGNLKSMLSFDASRVRPTVQVFVDGPIQNDTLSSIPVYVMRLNEEASVLTLPPVLANAVPERLNVFTEPRSSSWARQWLSSVQILSQGFKGQFVDGGSTRAQILMDLEVEYGARLLIYQPSGDSVVFSRLTSDQPLSSVHIRGVYVSRTGTQYPLEFVGIATVKLEFRRKK